MRNQKKKRREEVVKCRIGRDEKREGEKDEGKRKREEISLGIMVHRNI